MSNYFSSIFPNNCVYSLRPADSKAEDSSSTEDDDRSISSVSSGAEISSQAQDDDCSMSSTSSGEKAFSPLSLPVVHALAGSIINGTQTVNQQMSDVDADADKRLRALLEPHIGKGDRYRCFEKLKESDFPSLWGKIVEATSKSHQNGGIRGAGEIQRWAAIRFLTLVQHEKQSDSRWMNVSLIRNVIPPEVMNDKELITYLSNTMNPEGLPTVRHLIESLPIEAHLSRKTTVLKSLREICEKEHLLTSDMMVSLANFFEKYPNQLISLSDEMLLKIVQLYDSRSLSSPDVKLAETRLRNLWLEFQKNGLFKEAAIFYQREKRGREETALFTKNPFLNLKTAWIDLATLSLGVNRADTLQQSKTKWFAGVSIGLPQNDHRNRLKSFFEVENSIDQELMQYAIELFQRSDEDVFGVSGDLLVGAYFYLIYVYEKGEDEHREVIEDNVEAIAMGIQNHPSLGFENDPQFPSFTNFLAAYFLEKGTQVFLKALEVLKPANISVFIGNAEEDESSLEPAIMERLKQIPGLTDLKLTLSMYNEQGLIQGARPLEPYIFEGVGALTQLNKLQISVECIKEDYDEQWLHHLAGLNQLKTFIYSGSEAKYPNLSFDETFPKLPSLERVTLQKTLLSDRLLISLAELEKMTYLDLTGSEFETWALEELLREHKGVSQLYLAGCAIEPRILTTIAEEITGLKMLQLGTELECEVDLIANLKEKRPELSIQFVSTSPDQSFESDEDSSEASFDNSLEVNQTHRSDLDETLRAT